MNFLLIPLQASMGFGMILMFCLPILFLFFCLGFSNIYLNLIKRKYMKENTKQSFLIKIQIYILSIILGGITAVLTIAALLGILYLFTGDIVMD
jgi:hypothetical protein